MTLVEVLVATVLLAASFAGAFALITHATGMMLRTRNHYVATTLCLARLERARDFDYNLLSFLGETDPGGTLLDQEGAPTVDGAYRRHTYVAVDQPDSGVTVVRVRVEIRDPKTHGFDGAAEEMSAAFTRYLATPDE